MVTNYLTRLNSNLVASSLCFLNGRRHFLLPSTISKLNLCWLPSNQTATSGKPNDTIHLKEQALMSLFDKCFTMNHVKQIHAHIIQTGFDQDLFLAGKIIAFCAFPQRSDMDYAISVFERIENPDGFLWNTMIRGFGNANQPENAFGYLKRMQETGEKADNFTFSFLIKVCGQWGSTSIGKQLHCCIMKHGLQSHVFVRNTLIHMYGLLRDIETAYQVFEEIREPDLVAWNAVIDCHVLCGNWKEALDLFLEMLRSSIEPDEATIVVVISACSALGALEFGRWVHSCISPTGLDDIISVSNSLIHMYAKCGALEEAYDTFSKVNAKNIVTWNTMISGLANHGNANEALAVFSKMLEEELETPDHLTFLAVLCACSHGGLVDEGRRYFDMMSREYDIKPTIKHYGCMVDMLGRAGFVEEAYGLIMSMPIECNPIVWRALLAACRVQGNVELGETVRRHLLKLEPDHSSDYILSASMYASVGNWNEAVRLRNSMQDRGVQKPGPGNSFINF